MDMLLAKGESALDNGDHLAAIGHLTALTDHAPDFAAGFQARAAAFAARGDLGPALADLARALALEPRNFLALTQLGNIFDDLGAYDRALAAYGASLAVHPFQPEARDGVTRLTQKAKGLPL